ncbi:MAG: ABC transporter substrate-binding protein [Candidatus Sumerlaeaceae bacterium]|nr:ABC transporter substrate-binding protein [Candidatus Sumerlaeaceae bacterium]
MAVHSRKSGIVLMAVIGLCALMFSGCSRSGDSSPATAPRGTVLRLGYFPNVSHAQALLGVARGDFARALGDGTELQTSVFNAGPSVIEALYANRLDIAYIGPAPAINGFIRSRGEEVRVIAGAVENGVLIVANKNRNIPSLEALRGKTIAVPQIGNTQDISARAFVIETLKTRLKDNGGDTQVIPIPNPDIETLMSKDQLDAAWVPEPWGSRLVASGLGTVVAHERDLWPEKRFSLTCVIARRKFLEENPELVRRFLEAHVALTRDLQADRQQYAHTINEQLKRLTGKTLADEVIAGALRNVEFSVEPDVRTFDTYFSKGRLLGIFPGDTLDTGKLIDRQPLDAVLKPPTARNQETP